MHICIDIYYYFLSFHNKYPYFCNRTVLARPQLSLLDVFFQDKRVDNLRRAECSEVIYLTYLHENRFGVRIAVNGQQDDYTLLLYKNVMWF